MSSGYSGALLESETLQNRMMRCTASLDDSPLPRFVIERAFITLREASLSASPLGEELCKALSQARLGYDHLGENERIAGWSKGDLRRLLTRVALRWGAADLVPPATPETSVTEAEAFSAFRGLQSLGGFKTSSTSRYSGERGLMEMEVEVIGEEYISDVARYLDILHEAYTSGIQVGPLTPVELCRFVNGVIEGDARLSDFRLPLP